MENYMEFWEQALYILESRLSDITFRTWIKPLKPLNMTEDTFTLQVHVPFAKDIIEKKCLSEIESALTFINGGVPLKANIVLPSGDNAPSPVKVEEKNEEKNDKSNNFKLPNGLMPRYTFENFVIGSNNQMAHAAAVNVANNLGADYNPLFIYGGVGLGKTHLMHAIGNRVCKDNPNAKILYVSCETFTNELIDAIKDKTPEKFRHKYRNIDLLLIDDIQFISSKQATQEEFFFTFNDLWQNGKQIVITSDRHPSSIQNLTKRLVSRLTGGLPIDIGYPNMETSVAILRSKAESQNIAIENEVLRYIAEAVKTNIRDMEGALTTVIAYSRLINPDGKPIDMEMATMALKDTLGSSKPELTVEYIQQTVAEYHSFTVEELCSKKKTKDLALARQIAMYFSRKLLGNTETLVSVGNKFGGKDHSTVSHAIELVGKKMEDDPTFATMMIDIEKILTNK